MGQSRTEEEERGRTELDSHSGFAPIATAAGGDDYQHQSSPYTLSLLAQLPLAANLLSLAKCAAAAAFNLKFAANGKRLSSFGSRIVTCPAGGQCRGAIPRRKGDCWVTQ